MRYLALGLALGSAAFAANTGSTQPTFYKDVLPVLQRNCQNCHRPGEAGPMSFLTYESTRPWAKAIKTAVATKKMPPWFADPNHGKFANDRTMSPSDINTLVAWVDTGAKPGNSKDAPAPVKFVEGWAIGKPDMVLEMPLEFKIPASGTIDYQYVMIPTNFTEDRYVQFAEARPGDRERVHHIIAFIMDKDNPMLKQMKPGVPFVPAEAQRRAREAAAQNNGQAPQQQRRPQGEGGGEGGIGGGDFLVGYAPGAPPQTLKANQAKLVKAGSAIVLQMHYTANGKEGVDQSRIGLIFSKEKPTQRVLTLASQNNRFEIPPGDPNYEVVSTMTLHQEATLTGFLPHMHLRGKDFEFRAVYPTGEKEILLRVPKYDFSWQLWYVLDTPKVLPAGTRIECTAHFDNSPNNPANPDPKKAIRFGEQSWDEMMIGFFDVAVALDANPMDLMRPKKKPADD
jgi:hypothetical protein